jgi:hypothetical protein
MGRIAPRLLNSHRWDLNEKVEQLSSLKRLRGTIDRQIEAFEASDARTEDESKIRHAHLLETKNQLEGQIEQVGSDVAAGARVLRLLESGGIKADSSENRVAP